MAKKQEEKKDSLALANFENGMSIANIENFINSGALPVSDIETAITLATMGKEIGVSPLTALNNIHLIKGRAVISSHLLGALLKQHGYELRWTKDWVAEERNGSEQIVTEVTLYWESHMVNPDNGTKTWSDSFSVTWKEMEVAGYTDKQNWEKYPKNMLRARCLAYAVRAIAPQILMGMYTDSEMVDALDTDSEYTTHINDEGEMQVVATAEIEDVNFEQVN